MQSTLQVLISFILIKPYEVGAIIIPVLGFRVRTDLVQLLGLSALVYLLSELFLWSNSRAFPVPSSGSSPRILSPPFHVCQNRTTSRKHFLVVWVCLQWQEVPDVFGTAGLRIRYRAGPNNMNLAVVAGSKLYGILISCGNKHKNTSS